MTSISDEQFREIFQNRLEVFYNRALSIFQCYKKEDLADDIVILLTHAAERKKVEEVINILEEFYKKRLQINSIEKPPLGTDEMKNMLLDVCSKVLGLHLRTN